jgi:hypothetical protein
VQSARAAARPSRQNQKEKASDNSYHKILTTDLFNMSMEYNRRLCYSCISHLRRKLDYGKCRVEIIADS